LIAAFAPPGAAAHISRIMSTLFQSQAPHPLADRLRPRHLSEIVGQDHLLGPDGPIGRMVASGQLASIDPVGSAGLRQDDDRAPPADGTDLVFEPLSAVVSGVADLRKVFDGARKRREMGQGTLLFVDEIHRFKTAPSRMRFCRSVEDGTVILVGATTEKPVLRIDRRAVVARSGFRATPPSTTQALETLLGARRAEHSVMPCR